jgi:methionine-rich copper-binding protein CopC
MKRSSSFLTVFAALPVLAFAHAHLSSSTPADGSVVAAAPKSIMLMFSEPTRVTALTMQKGEEKAEQKLGPLPEEASAHVMVPTPKLAPGAYTIRWRALGRDNHVIKGTIKFTVSADATTGAGKAATAEHDPHSH